MAQNIKIVGGPGKFELMLAIFEGKEVTFTFEEGTKKTVRLDSIQREDGSNESWNIQGHYSPGHFPPIDFRLYYTTRGNHGRLDYPWFMPNYAEAKSEPECQVHGSIEHMQSITGKCPGCGKP